MQQTLMHNARADADQRKLAEWEGQDAKTVTAPRERSSKAATEGGPSTLLTGGTASDALAAKRPRVAIPSLLGG